ncbi:hypothetical protein [Cellulomonas fengjieae]|uniref:Glycosyltransferase RgtA/B/C/D-like domain-containing protein n=1 Tax=Cellulomonas fengjieae TaxID=2819978 RepID=A0ABS3SEC2_9CELL|nr:hypothetical protein [Cellulomonas fengjieae]MBO3083834.1 hypothetical protein [Cellulomonas fengjieae]QVI64880.1 hypothetical protein KG102_12020 [Cellulomonas fengjieae]
MVSTLIWMAAALVVLFVLGLAVLAPMRPRRRAALVPAAPLLGAALLAVVMSTSSWWLDARGGLAVTAVVAAVLVVVGVRRGTSPWRVDLSAVGLAVLLVGIGAIGAAVALLPSAWAGDGRALSANDSGDVFFYVAESAWMGDHPISPVPEPGAVPGEGNATPADVPLRAALAFPLRVGQPLVHAALGAVTGQPAVGSVMGVMALWIALLAPAAFVSGRLLRLGRLASMLLAAVCATSAVVVQQSYQQNVDALLGAGLALLTIGAVMAATERRLPLWPAALVTAALAGVYTEYALFVVPAVLGAVLLRRPRGLGRRAGRLLAVLGMAVAMAPTSWVRGVQALTLPRAGDGFGSPLFSDGWFAAVSRVVGTAALAEPVGAAGPNLGTALVVVLAATLVLGWVLALVLDRHRGMWFALLAVGLGYLGFLTAEHRGYTQVRAASVLLPLLLLASAAGWSTLGARLRRAARVRTGGTARSALAPRLVTGLTATLTAIVVVAVVVNVRSAPDGIDRGRLPERHVDATYDEAARWVDEDGGEGGQGVTVLAADLFSQMWLAHALREDPLVSYVSLRPDYLGMTTYWAGEQDPFLLVGPGAFLDADPAAVVAQNDRFRMVDLGAAPAVAAVPLDLPTWSPYAQADGSMIGPDGGKITVVRSPGLTGPVELELAAAGAGEVRATVLETGQVARADIVDGRALVPVELGDASIATIQLDVGAEGAEPTQQLALIGVHGAP